MPAEQLQLLEHANYKSEVKAKLPHFFQQMLDQLKHRELVFCSPIQLDLGKEARRVSFADNAVVIMGKNPSVSDLNPQMLDEIRRLNRPIQYLRFIGINSDTSMPDTALLFDTVKETARASTRPDTQTKLFFTDLPLVKNLNNFDAQWLFHYEKDGKRIVEPQALNAPLLSNPNNRMSITNSDLSFVTSDGVIHTFKLATTGGTNGVQKVESLVYSFQK